MNQQVTSNKYTLKDWATVIALAANFGGLVWFAATLNATVHQLESVQIDQKAIMARLTDNVTSNTIDIAVLKGKK